MTPNDAAKLLAVAAAFDNRKPDAIAANAWAMSLAEHSVEDCQQAIVKHYQDSTEWIMPAHVIAIVKKVRAGRIEDVAPTPPEGLDPDDTGAYARWLGEERRRIGDGLPPRESPYNPTRHIRELKGVLRAVPAIEAKPPTRTSEHQAALDKARAELATHPARTLPTLREPEPDVSEPNDEEQQA